MTGTKLHDPQALRSTAWLADHLEDPDLRLFDCSTVLEFTPEGARPYRVLPCREEHEAGHIPGAQFLDLQADFSDDASPYGMTLASPSEVTAAFARAGVSDTSQVVLYSRRGPSWATRFWWMLRWIGFDHAAILDGGFEKWVAEGRPLSTTGTPYPPGKLTAHLRPDIFVGKEAVLKAIGDPTVCTISALGRDLHSGENARYGRPGRIPASVNLPQVELIDPETHAFLPLQVIADRFAKVGTNDAEGFITYCGGGIFATVNAFWLHQLGHDRIAVYDNSMSEWGPDESLPIERD